MQAHAIIIIIFKSTGCGEGGRTEISRDVNRYKTKTWHYDVLNQEEKRWILGRTSLLKL